MRGTSVTLVLLNKALQNNGLVAMALCLFIFGILVRGKTKRKQDFRRITCIHRPRRKATARETTDKSEIKQQNISPKAAGRLNPTCD